MSFLAGRATETLSTRWGPPVLRTDPHLVGALGRAACNPPREATS